MIYLENNKTKRNRKIYFLLVVGTMVLGLSSRKFGYFLPYVIGQYAGDTLWALMVFFILGLLFNQWATKRLFVLALSFSYIIELTQLYHGPIIDGVRDTLLGRLVLGQGFLWSDLVCYLLGVLLGVGIDYLILKKWRKNENRNNVRG